MRIGVDIMGGDNAPDEILKGAFAALPKLPAEDTLVLFGKGDLIEEAIKDRSIARNGPGAKIEVVHCSEVIEMDDVPVEAVRSKRDSSISRAAEYAGPKHPNRCDAWISAGNTGACVTASQMYMRRLPNVIRPGIAVTIPTFAGPIVLIDVGANIQPKPVHLAQYGIMGDAYARAILGIKNPRVAMMNVGGEEQKGTSDMKIARDLLRGADNLNFIGYVEGRGVFDGEADVVITDGVVGNVMIKLAEGLSKGLFQAIAHQVLETDPELAVRLEPVVKAIWAKHDYHEYGGAPLLGVNGICLISHGSSVARTMMNAILRSRQFVLCGINDIINTRLETIQEPSA
ncbi:MAG: phosphate acyltransferase PlsX [Planctomycetota bacterium]|jgi:glycerol-3-phosphate acyltransferase PlsX|nr:MAG: phosphate acyltransferase PlsX [Planctomycetota bacterium]